MYVYVCVCICIYMVAFIPHCVFVCVHTHLSRTSSSSPSSTALESTVVSEEHVLLLLWIFDNDGDCIHRYGSYD